MKKQLLTLVLVPALIFGAVTIPLPKEASAASTGQIVNSVSLRQSADVNSTRIRYLKEGEKVTILSKVNSWWYKVKASDGREGYISTSAKYIQASGVTSPGIPIRMVVPAVVLEVQQVRMFKKSLLQVKNI